MFNLQNGSPPQEFEIQSAIKNSKFYVHLLYAATGISCVFLFMANLGSMISNFIISTLMLLACYIISDDMIAERRKYLEVDSKQLQKLFVWCGKNQTLANYFSDIKRKPVIAEFIEAKSIMDKDTRDRLTNQDNSQFKAILNSCQRKPNPSSKHDGDVEIEV